MVQPDAGTRYLLHLRAAVEDAPALEELLSAAGYVVSLWCEDEAREALLSVYFDTRDAAAAGYADLQRRLIAWQEWLGSRPALDGPVVLPPEDWRESWKRHFHARRVSPRLWVKPSWESVDAPGATVIELDPGMSFGTGLHGTTRACLQFVDELAGPDMAVLDLGCGSGILAIAAARLGCRPVYAVDHDPAALQATRDNAARNHVADRIRVIDADLADASPIAPSPVPLVVANLLAGILTEHAQRIAALTTPDGHLVLSGILEEELVEVMDCYGRLGWCVHRRIALGEWASACLVQRQPCGSV